MRKNPTKYCLDCPKQITNFYSKRCKKCAGKERRSHLSERFWNKVVKTDGCWIWTGSLNTCGYGIIGVDRKTIHSHRIAWELINGTIPNRMSILHHCDRPPCVNPSHLFLGTQQDNIKDMLLKNRGKGGVGVRNCKARLSENDVREIRKRHIRKYGNLVILAKEFNVDPCTILDIIKRRSWKHIV
jgi:hypothetical protein